MPHDATSASVPCEKRIVLLTSDGPAQRYVANTLCGHLNIAAIIIDRGKRTTLRSRIASWRRRYSLPTIASKAARAALMWVLRDRRAQARSWRRHFGQDIFDSFHRADLLRQVECLSSDSTQRLLLSLKPDVLLVYGCGIVPQRLLATAGTIALNMHTGLSPRYRGTHCAFWPIVENRLDMLGATVHTCTIEIDGGAIHEQVRVGIKPGDTVHDVFARCVSAGAAAYARTAKRFVEGAAPVENAQHPTDGGVYVAADRGVVAELRARWRLRRLRGGALGERIALGPCEELVDWTNC